MSPHQLVCNFIFPQTAHFLATPDLTCKIKPWWHLNVRNTLSPHSPAWSEPRLPTSLGPSHQDLGGRPFILPQGWPKLP